MSFFRFPVLICLFLSSLFSHQIEFKGQVLSLSGYHQNSSEADVVRIQLTAFDVLQKEALPNAAVAWLKNNRELSIAKKDFPAEALKELEVFSAAPFYPLHLPFSQAPAIKGEGLLCTGTFSLMQTEEQWQIKNLQLKDFAFTETIPVATDNGELFSVVIPEIAQFSLMVIPSEIKNLPTEQLSADESLKALDEYGNGYACGTLNSGAYYCGWFQDWRPHGKGQIRYTSGNEYTGDFLYGYRWGYGIYKFKASGDRYEGNFVQNLFDGKGTYYWASGAVFTGIYSEGKRYGEGKYVKGTFSLEGIWVNDVPSGVMTAIERNRWHYNGLWDGTPHGFGTIRFPSATNPQPDQYDGDWYEGLFNYGKFQGLGTYHWENGSEYFGNWVNGIREGNGTYKRYDDLYYDGQWKSDRFHGKGKLIIPKNFTYEGSFENGQTHGQGKCVWDDGREYEGSWAQGQMHGYGIHIWPKSSAARRFTGWFYQGKPKGEGEFETDGLVENSTILYKTKNWAVAANNGFGGAYTGNIEFRFTNGNRDNYEGKWKDLALNGSGKALFHNGDIYEGEWRNNKFHGKGMYEWTAQNLPNPANSSAVYSGEWYEGIPVYNGLATFLKELEVSNDPNDYFEDVPPALQEEFKKLISAWEEEYRSHIFHHERAAAAATGVFFGSGAVAGLSPLLAQVAFYTSGSSLVIAATAAAPYVAAIGAGVAAGLILEEVYNRQKEKREKAVAATKSKVDEEKGLGLIYGRWDRNNKLTSVDKSGQLIIRGKEGQEFDLPEKEDFKKYYTAPDFGVSAPVYQYIGRTTQTRYECRKSEHNWALGRVFKKNGWGTPQIYHFYPKEENIVGTELEWKVAEQHWVEVVGGLGFDPKNLQNKINPIGLGTFEKLFGPFSQKDAQDLQDFITVILECALD